MSPLPVNPLVNGSICQQETFGMQRFTFCPVVMISSGIEVLRHRIVLLHGRRA